MVRSDADPIPECQDCGICCRASVPDYVELSDFEIDNIPERMVKWIDTFPFMRMRKGACIAFRSCESRCSCAVYEHRPNVCRDFERGGSRCRHFLQQAEKLKA